MRLSVNHVTEYHYDMPLARVIQSYRMTPSAHAGMRVLSWDIAVEGGHFGARFVDGAGDLVQTMSLPGPVSELRIAVTGTVETSDTSGVLRDHREMVSPAVYLRKTRATAPGIALKELDDGLGAPGADVLGEAHRMADLVAETVEYTPGSTRSDMTADEALALRQGVCQDHAQVLIALARMRGMPARYVTGYLHSDSSGAEHEASHAWAELHVEGLGWTGFDPANRCCPDARYIRIGSGLDAVDAALIRGISLGAARETMDISVNVAQQQ